MILQNVSCMKIKICLVAFLISFCKPSLSNELLLSAMPKVSQTLYAQAGKLEKERIKQEKEEKRREQEKMMQEEMKEMTRYYSFIRPSPITLGLIILFFGILIWRRAYIKIGKINKVVYEQGTPSKYEGYEKLIFQERWARLRVKIGFVMCIIAVGFILLGIEEVSEKYFP